MNRAEGYALLTVELNSYRQLAHAELVELIGDETSIMRRGSDGTHYSIELWVRWYDAAAQQVVVSGSVSPADWGSPHDRLDDSFVVSGDSSVS